MSRADAIRDGIKFEYGKFGMYYNIPCSNCGRIFRRRNYTENTIRLCDDCRKIKKKKINAHVAELALSMPDAETKEEKRYRKAVERIEKQCGSLDGYEKAINICRKATYKFASVPEAMLAIELVKNGYRVIPQQKIGQYHVDFALPNEKLIIEVDGSIYHTNTQKELEREAVINYTIGLDWHVLHIPAESISDNVRKVVKLIKMRDTGDN